MTCRSGSQEYLLDPASKSGAPGEWRAAGQVSADGNGGVRVSREGWESRTRGQHGAIRRSIAAAQRALPVERISGNALLCTKAS
ncbi:hypothetical protein ASZ90_010737 [hydrocarbon metagenome]|uniref:Uncharacterized protein n=1 Tax=hydrocarbon metagenome TaxID=938273 RepID=A0A0W8FF70_9ZZZZ